jgi:uncharacterized protein (DUF302 family)
MKTVIVSDKSINEVCQALEEAVPAHKFGIVATHDLKATMNKKGVEFEPEVRVYEVCNPMKAKAVLSEDIDLASALPCRISVYEKEGKTHIAMINPTAMLKMLNPSETLQVIAQEVEQISLDIMNSAK